jgi:hypothetical protein
MLPEYQAVHTKHERIPLRRHFACEERSLFVPCCRPASNCTEKPSALERPSFSNGNSGLDECTEILVDDESSRLEEAVIAVLRLAL